MNNRLSQFAVYTIRRLQDLDEIYSTKGGKGRFTERRKWVTALSLFEKAKQAGVRLPIIFADAGDTGEGLMYYAFISDLSDDKSTTTYSFEGLNRIYPRRPLHSLRLRSTGKPLSDRFIKPLAYVYTPEYIRNSLAKTKSSTSRPRGCWLYPISERGNRFFVLDDGEKYPVSIDTYKMLVENGRLSEDERWGLHTNFHQIHRRDEVLVYTGDQNLGIVGYATVMEIDLEDRALVLKFDLKKCEALLMNPVPAKTVRKWIPHPRAAVCNLSPFRADVYRRLPWNQHEPKKPDILTTPMPTILAGFGAPEMNREVEKAAVKRVRKMYLSNGWSVTSVEDRKLGFDLFCKRGTEVKKAEVKGVRGRNVGFLITAGELRKASEDGHFVLHVVIEALSKHPQVKTWGGKECSGLSVSHRSSIKRRPKLEGRRELLGFNPAETGGTSPTGTRWNGLGSGFTSG